MPFDGNPPKDNQPHPVLDVLEQVHDLLSDESRWCTGRSFFGPQDAPTAWCLTGAIEHVVVRQGLSKTARNLAIAALAQNSPLRERVLDGLRFNLSYCEDEPYIGNAIVVQSHNDAFGYDQAIDLLRKTIAQQKVAAS